jgi:hypothetical protein
MNVDTCPLCTARIFPHSHSGDTRPEHFRNSDSAAERSAWAHDKVVEQKARIDAALAQIDLEYLDYKPHKAIDVVKAVHAALTGERS